MHQGHVGSLAGIIQIQECLLCLTRGIACVIDTAEHALERRLVWSEREYTSVGGQLEVRVAVHIRDGAEREGHLEEAEEELVEVLSRKGVRVNADDAVGANETVERPLAEVQLGVLVDEAVADALAVLGWWDALDLEGLPSCYAYDAERSGGEMARVEEDAPGGGADGSEVRRFGANTRARASLRAWCTSRCRAQTRPLATRDLTYLRKVSMWRIAVSCGRQGHSG